MSKYLNGIVPCSVGGCLYFATVYATKGSGVTGADYFCDDHIPEGWRIQDGQVGSTEVQIILNRTI